MFVFPRSHNRSALIGAIGEVERLSNYSEFKKHLGVSAENKTSGTSVAKIRKTYEGVREELVTSTDFASEIIREAVASAYPKHGILSEETTDGV